MRAVSFLQLSGIDWKQEMIWYINNPFRWISIESRKIKFFSENRQKMRDGFYYKTPLSAYVFQRFLRLLQQGP